MDFQIQRGQPIKWAQAPSTRAPRDSPYAALGDTLKAYRDAAKRLLETKYPELRELAPPHLQGRCSCLAIVCEDGLVLRWDDDTETPKVRIATASITPSEDRLEVWAPRLSERYVWCPPDASSFRLPDDGPHIQFLKIGPGAPPQVVTDVAFGIVVNRSEAPAPSDAAGRPLPMASLMLDVEIVLHMEVFDADKEPKPGSGQEALVRQRFRLPVGWSAFEIYPKFEATAWKPEGAAAAAEIDLLGIAARHNLRERAFHAVDSRAAARREYWRLLDEFRGLLTGDEAPVQAFLAANPALLSPAHLKAWPKLPLGGRVTDFVLREAAAEYVLVELEAPTRHLFRKDGQQHQDLTHAVDQITDWLRYLEDNLSTVQRELGLVGISANPKTIIVIGRSSGLSDADRRKLTTAQNLHPKLQILTYDDVLAAAEATVANLLGPRLFSGTSAEVYYIWDKETLVPPA